MFVLRCATNSDSISITLNFQVTREFFFFQLSVTGGPKKGSTVRTSCPSGPFFTAEAIEKTAKPRRLHGFNSLWPIAGLTWLYRTDYYYYYLPSAVTSVIVIIIIIIITIIITVLFFFMKYNHFLFNDLRKCKNLERFLKRLAPNP